RIAPWRKRNLSTLGHIKRFAASGLSESCDKRPVGVRSCFASLGKESSNAGDERIRVLEGRASRNAEKKALLLGGESARSRSIYAVGKLRQPSSQLLYRGSMSTPAYARHVQVLRSTVGSPRLTLDRALKTSDLGNGNGLPGAWIM